MGPLVVNDRWLQVNNFVCESVLGSGCSISFFVSYSNKVYNNFRLKCHFLYFSVLSVSIYFGTNWVCLSVAPIWPLVFTEFFLRNVVPFTTSFLFLIRRLLQLLWLFLIHKLHILRFLTDCFYLLIFLLKALLTGLSVFTAGRFHSDLIVLRFLMTLSVFSLWLKYLKLQLFLLTHLALPNTLSLQPITLLIPLCTPSCATVIYQI